MNKLFTFVALLLATSVTAFAQKIGGAPAAPPLTMHVRHAAVLPLLFFKDDKPSDNKAAIATVRDELNAVLDKFCIDRVDLPHVVAAWSSATGQPFDDQRYQLPEPEDLVKLGHWLGVDQVIFVTCKWHTNSVWQGLGPKTHADAKVDLWIVDVHNSEFEFKANVIPAGDTEREPVWKSAVTLFIAPISIVSGGPETPHMQRAGVIALDTLDHQTDPRWRSILSQAHRSMAQALLGHS